MKNIFLNKLRTISVISGLMCGYVLGVIAYMFPTFQKEFGITTLQISVLAGAILFGCFVSSIYTGILTDLLGRKWVSLIVFALFLVGGIIFEGSHTMYAFYVARLIQGLAFGMAVIVLPIYFAEMSPKERRGQVITSFQLSMTSGILLASILGMFVIHGAHWHILVTISLLFPIFLLFEMLFMPESAHYLIGKRRFDEAKKILKRIHPFENSDELLKSIQERRSSKISFKEGVKLIFKRSNFIAILIVTCAVSLNQLTGINAFLQCSLSILRDSGINSNAMGIIGGISITIINFIATIVTLSLVEKIGRKAILKIGTSGLFITFFVLALVHFVMPTGLITGWVTLVGIIMLIGFFAFGPGGVILVLSAELLPNCVRSLGISIAFTVGALVGMFFVSDFMKIAKTIGYSGLFLLIACFIIGYFIIAYKIPETKGRALEEIEAAWQEK
ncbi:MAG: sugar porter family MFS transporter [Fusobacteria bacterium]|nr:sugar porter family MFS transporter [Fusobacteriota bacterium]